MAVGWTNGLTRWVGYNVATDIIAGLATSLTGCPVIDATALKGKFDFVIDRVEKSPLES